MLRWRFATAAILAPAILAAIYWGRWTILVVALVFAGLAAYELSRALRSLPFAAILGATFLPILLAIPLDELGVLAGIMFSLPWMLVWLMMQPDLRSLRSLAALLLGSVWVGGAFAHLVLLSELPEYAVPMLVAVVGPWISDTGAYFSGRFFGRRLLFPHTSPKKTVEGAIGGLLLTVLLVGAISAATLEFSLWAAGLLGLVVAVFSQAGDLFESLLKRILDLKDSGTILPGHGGALDRVDSLLFTAPAVYYTLLIL
jgi:phosphatidate cytidylyltransferase